MKEYSELELNKMMAELEGENFIVYKGKYILHENDQGHMYENNMTMDWYSPLENWGLLGPLMVKYKVEIDYLDCECSIWRDDLIEAKATTRFNSESEIPRAIIMCILKSENII